MGHLEKAYKEATNTVLAGSLQRHHGMCQRRLIQFLKFSQFNDGRSSILNLSMSSRPVESCLSREDERCRKLLPQRYNLFSRLSGWTLMGPSRPWQTVAGQTQTNGSHYGQHSRRQTRLHVNYCSVAAKRTEGV